MKQTLVEDLDEIDLEDGNDQDDFEAHLKSLEDGNEVQRSGTPASQSSGGGSRNSFTDKTAVLTDNTTTIIEKEEEKKPEASKD